MATQLYMELGNRRLMDLFSTLENAHVNYYEHQFDQDEVQYQIDNCRRIPSRVGIGAVESPETIHSGKPGTRTAIAAPVTVLAR